MAGTFQPSISYWPGQGLPIPATGVPTPSGALNQNSLLLLIHGYNNTEPQASSSYDLFYQLQENLVKSVTANVVGVYWPGANWENALYYLQALGQQKKVAPALAADLYAAAKARGYLKVDIIAHSLGCRLTLETIDHLLDLKINDTNPANLVIDKVIFMAGAVPISFVEERKCLSPALNNIQGSLSLYSGSDMVLALAFPAAEIFEGAGFFPVALGHKLWTNGTLLSPPVKQQENKGAGHSDYWGGDNKNLAIKRQAAKFINAFMPLGVSSGVETASRDTASARSSPDRTNEANRATPSRNTPT